MSHIDSSGGAAVLVRATDAELVGFPSQTVGSWPIARPPAEG